MIRLATQCQHTGLSTKALLQKAPQMVQVVATAPPGRPLKPAQVLAIYPALRTALVAAAAQLGRLVATLGPIRRGTFVPQLEQALHSAILAR
jgi:hypothetical protein